jgi:phage shock protein PspC (stress-responsive transcriptional regulator)
MKDTFTAYIRTYAPLIAGAIIGLGAKYGLDIADSEQAIVTLITVFGGAAYYALARLIGKKYPQVEAVMLGSGKTPIYK